MHSKFKLNLFLPKEHAVEAYKWSGYNQSSIPCLGHWMERDCMCALFALFCEYPLRTTVKVMV